VSFIRLKLLLATTLFFYLQGCALSPTERVNKLADTLGFERKIVQASEFRHVVYFANQGSAGKTLHVYLEGDGLPWVSRQKISADPTTRSSVMLPLMGIDTNPAVYVGRPCYQGLSNDPGCNAALWTFSRYSQQVVDSMTEVIRQIVSRHGYTSVKLMGHSGGGTLALLIAQNLPETTAIVTLAGNLDIDAWTDHHHYTPLYGSLNPVEDAVLNPAIYQLHLQAVEDQQVPPKLAKKWLVQQTNAEVYLYPKFNHRCCWKDVWQKVLTRVQFQ
jgi:hypothetical protein